MSWYKTGAVTVTNGSADVVGAGTGWTADSSFADAFTLDGDKFYEISHFVSPTHLVLAQPYAGATAAGVSYAIVRNFPSAVSADVVAALAQLLLKWQARETELAAWQGGTVMGGPGGDGLYPITSADNTVNMIACPAKLQALAGATSGSAIGSPAYASALTLDCDNFGTFVVGTLTGDITINLAGGGAGKRVIVILAQDGTGARTPTFGPSVSYGSDLRQEDLLFSTLPNKTDIIGFINKGTSYVPVSLMRGY